MLFHFPLKFATIDKIQSHILLESLKKKAIMTDKTKYVYTLPDEGIWRLLSLIERDTILKICISVGASLDETQKLLQITNKRRLNEFNLNDLNYIKLIHNNSIII